MKELIELLPLLSAAAAIGGAWVTVKLVASRTDRLEGLFDRLLPRVNKLEQENAVCEDRWRKLEDKDGCQD